MPEPQTYANHVRRDGAFLALAILNLALFVTAAHQALRHRDVVHCLLFGLALSAASAAMAARRYALKNQDRIIRLEETLRLQRLGVDPAAFTVQQLIALRFAPDAEVPVLARRTASENLSPTAIKQAVQNWRADTLRV